MQQEFLSISVSMLLAADGKDAHNLQMVSGNNACIMLAIMLTFAPLNFHSININSMLLNSKQQMRRLLIQPARNFGPKKKDTLLRAHHVLATTGKSCLKKKVAFSQIDISL